VGKFGVGHGYIHDFYCYSLNICRANQMKYIFALPSIAILTVAGFLWWLAYLAFGNARCQGLNAFALAALSGLTVMFIYITFAATDWLNDWIATRAVTKAQITTNKTLAEQARTIATQVAAGRKLAGQTPPEGGLDYDLNLMDQLTEG
jgi:hypothetical protein